MARISDKIFREIVNIIYRESGIVLNDKRELVEARLASLSRKKGYKDAQDILDRLKGDEKGDQLIELLDQISTNLTYFFREPAHFDFLSKKLMPDLLAQKKLERNNRIRFWSAACSSGEEAYSLAITANEYIQGDNSWDLKILATDISTKMLRKAFEGKYSRQEVLRAPSPVIQKNFQRHGDRHHPVYEVNPDIKKMVSFRRFNLLEEKYPFSGLFDLIICRNVMIYFDLETKKKLLQQFYHYMAKGGHLFTGHAESLSGFDYKFKRVQVAVYKK